MHRLGIYLKRRPDLLQTRFFSWWLGQHRDLAEDLPGLRQYTISLAAEAEDGPFDGMAELWFDDQVAAEAAFANPGLKRRGDMDRPAFAHWWLEHHVPYVGRFPSIRKYHVSLVESGPETIVDGLAEVWFDALATLHQVMASDVVKEAQQHSEAHSRDRIRLVVEEHRIC